MLILFKTCYICQTEKSYLEFSKQSAAKDGLAHYCKICAQEKSKKRYIANTERMKEQSRNWAKNNKELARKYRRRHIKNNPIVKIKKNLQKTAKEKNIKSSIGCSKQEFKMYIESQFTKEMTWENYGKIWGIYKKKKILDFEPEKLHELNHFSNLEPKMLPK